MTADVSPATPVAEETPTLVIEMWADIACPWCLLGKRRLDEAVVAAGAAGRVEVVLRSFELNPDLSTTVRVEELLVAKTGRAPEEVRAMDGQVADLARAEGLRYSLDRPIANSLDIHRVLHLARAHGVATGMFTALQRGYFAGDLDPFDHDTLIRMAEQAGVPAEETRRVLAGDAYADAVRAEQATGRARGLTAVPFVVMGGRYAVSGAQSVDDYATAIRTALAAPA